MKKVVLLCIVFLSCNSFAALDIKDCSEEDQCKFKDCSSFVMESHGNTAMATCREVYKLKEGKHAFVYKEVKMLGQAKSEDGKTTIMTGNTIRLP